MAVFVEAACISGTLDGTLLKNERSAYSSLHRRYCAERKEMTLPHVFN